MKQSTSLESIIVSDRLRRSAFAAALALGVAGDLLLRVPGRPALNVLIWALAGVAALVIRLRLRGDTLRGETLMLVTAAVAFAAAMVWRATDALTVMNLALAAGLVTFAAARGGLPWLRTSGVGDWLVAFLRVGLMMAAGAFKWLDRTPVVQEEDAQPPAWRGTARLVLRGTALALPVLFVFAALLANADPVFEHVLQNMVDISDLLPHLAFALVLSWLTLGYLRAFDTVPSEDVAVPDSPSLSPNELAIALGLVNALFLLFLVIQVRYFFGGATLVEITPGLGYAEYARRGFFELVAVAALVIPLQLLADWAAAPASTHDRRVLRMTAFAQLVLLGGIIVSAVQRMQLYQEAYGLTELRLYVSLFMGWVTFVLVWLAATVLRGRRDNFAIGALVSALACAAALNVINPQALIVRTNVARAIAGREYDPAYAGSLGADAVPTLVRLLPQLAEADRCIIQERLVKLAEQPALDWRVWNYGEWRGREALRTITMQPCPVVMPPAGPIIPTPGVVPMTTNP